MSQKEHITIRSVENRLRLLVQATLSLVVGYFFAWRAIDSGSYWHYLLSFVAIGFLVNAVGRLTKDIVRQYQYGRKKR